MRHAVGFLVFAVALYAFLDPEDTVTAAVTPNGEHIPDTAWVIHADVFTPDRQLASTLTYTVRYFVDESACKVHITGNTFLRNLIAMAQTLPEGTKISNWRCEQVTESQPRG